MKTAFFVLVVAAVFGAFLCVPLAAAFAPGLNVSLVSQQPFPVEPGQNVEVELEIRNTGIGEARNVALLWTGAEPFTLLPGQEQTVIIGLLPGQSAITKVFRFRTDPAAFSGTYLLEWKLDIGGTILTEKTAVSVRGTPRIILQSVRMEPAVLDAGGRAQLTFFLQNAGTGTARRLAAGLNGTPDVIPLFASSVFLGDVLPGAFATTTLEVGIEATAGQKTNVLQLTIEAEDEAGNPLTRVFPVGIPVSGTVLLDILKVSADPARRTLDVELANKGSAEAKAVEAWLFSGVERSDVDYVSQIKPDKKATFSFPLPDTDNFSLQLRYRGPGLEQQERTFPLTVTLPQQANSPPLGIIIVIAILLAVGVWYWRTRKAADPAGKNNR